MFTGGADVPPPTTTILVFWDAANFSFASIRLNSKILSLSP